MLGHLAEAAAEAIGADSLLARVSGYYHDIGKTKMPDYFIENQAKGFNRHDRLEPSMSALIIAAHVKEGVEMARQGAAARADRDRDPRASRHQADPLLLPEGRLTKSGAGPGARRRRPSTATRARSRRRGSSASS